MYLSNGALPDSSVATSFVNPRFRRCYNRSPRGRHEKGKLDTIRRFMKACCRKKGKDTNQRAPKDVADWKCGKTGMKTDDHIHRSKAKQLAIEPTKPFGSSAPQKAHEILMQPDSQLGSRRRSASRWRMRKQLAPACLSLQAVCGA